MKRLTFLTLLLLSTTIFAQDDIPYAVGEYVSYNISFGKIRVGNATMEILEEVTLNNQKCLHIVGKGRTAPFFDWFFKVRDVYETYFNTDSLYPIQFIRDVNEGGHKINQHYIFKHSIKNVVTQDSSYTIADNSQDMLSALFFARTFNKENVTDSSSFFVPIFMDNENYFLEIVYLSNEKVKTKWGLVDCMVFKPKMQEGRVFEDGEKMKIWITDDANHLLLKVETKIWAGTISAIINDYKVLKKPLSIIDE